MYRPFNFQPMTIPPQDGDARSMRRSPWAVKRTPTSSTGKGTGSDRTGVPGMLPGHKEAPVRRIGYMIAGVVLGAIVALQVPSLAQDTGSSDPGTTQRTVTVSGRGTITSAPDEAVIGACSERRRLEEGSSWVGS